MRVKQICIAIRNNYKSAEQSTIMQKRDFRQRFTKLACIFEKDMVSICDFINAIPENKRSYKHCSSTAIRQYIHQDDFDNTGKRLASTPPAQ